MGSNSRSTYSGRWSSFPHDYRKEELERIARMISNQQSGMVVGGSGTGKSNISGILATRPDLIVPLLPADKEYLFCLVDINKLSQNDPMYFYRGMLRELYKAAQRADLSIAKALRQLEVETRQWNDEQSWFFAMEDAHELVINQANKQLVWLLDRFDKACPTLDNSTLDALRSLRDETIFNGKLFYLAFSRKPLPRLRDWSRNSEFLEIIESNTCWVGPMVERDARWNVQQIAQRQQGAISETAETLIIQLTGGLPAFTKAATEAWLEEPQPQNKSAADWTKILTKQALISRTSREILDDLEFIERKTLVHIASGKPQIGLNPTAVSFLMNNGLLKAQDGHFSVFSPLFEAHLRLVGPPNLGILAIDKAKRTLLLDDIPIDIHLAPMEYKLLDFMLEHPAKVLTFDELIGHLWGDDHEDDDTYERKGPLAAQIGNLKRKLHDYSQRNEIKPSLGDRISNKHGHGYRFDQPNIVEGDSEERR